MRIGKRALEDMLRQPHTGPAQVFWDEKTPGFGLRRGPRGVTFLLKYRVRGKPAQLMERLGRYPGTDPEAARLRAIAIHSAAAMGRDLVAEEAAAKDQAAADTKRASALAIPVTDLLDEWRAEIAAEILVKQGAGASIGYERELLRLEEKVLRPFVGGETLGQFDATHRLQQLVDLEKAVSSARNVRSMLSRVARFLNLEMRRRAIPVAWPRHFEVHGTPTSRWQRFSMDEVAALWIAAGSLGRPGALARFLILTGARRTEAGTLKVSALHLDDAQLGPHWVQKALSNKSKREHMVPLNPPAVALLRWLPLRSTRTTPDTDYVFSGRAGRPYSAWTDLKRNLMARAGLEEGRLHDLRRSLVSTMADHGINPEVADKMLNHASSATLPGVMGVYQRSELWQQRVEASARWADVLFAAIEKRLGRAVDRESWGFDAPFVEVRMKRPLKASDKAAQPVAPAAASRLRARRSAADREPKAISPRSHSSKDATE